VHKAQGCKKTKESTSDHCLEGIERVLSRRDLVSVEPGIVDFLHFFYTFFFCFSSLPMPSLDSQIDQELRAFLAAVDEYQACTVELAASCKSGCFDIARARKAMSGQGSTVSQLQYPAVFTARVGVQVDIDSDHVMKLKSVEEIPKTDSKSSEEDTVPRSVDPLKWFGILVPEHLRNSQRTFSRGLEVNYNAIWCFFFFSEW
jgi:hypothetical protein